MTASIQMKIALFERWMTLFQLQFTSTNGYLSDVLEINFCKWLHCLCERDFIALIKFLLKTMTHSPLIALKYSIFTIADTMLNDSHKKALKLTVSLCALQTPIAHVENCCIMAYITFAL